MTRHRSRRRIKLGSLYVWHRYLGVTVAMMIVLLSVTGIMLNHTGALNLDKKYVKSASMLDWYGIDLPVERTGFGDKNLRVSLLGHQLYLNNIKIKGEHSRLSGFVVSNDVLVVAINNGLLLLTVQGEVIEQLDARHGLPSDIKQLGMIKGKGIAVRSPSGIYIADENMTVWERASGVTDTTWSVSTNIPEHLLSEISRLYRGHDLPLERVLLDLHSGRILGRWGPMFMDAAAIVMVLLSLSGLWLWAKGIIRRRNHRRRKGTPT